MAPFLSACAGCPFVENPESAVGAEAGLCQLPHTEPRGPNFKGAHKPPIQGQQLGFQMGLPQPPAARLAQTRSQGTSHPSLVPTTRPHSGFQERMCLVWIRQCWPRDTENRLIVPNATVWPVSAQRGQGSQKLSSQRAAAPRRHTRSRGEAGCGEAPATPSSPPAATHKVPFMGTRRAGHWQLQPQGNQVWVFSEGTTRPLS